MNEKLRLVLLIIFGLFLAALLGRNATLAWLTLPFLGYLGAGLLTCPPPARLRALRQVDPPRCEAGAPITMTVTIQNEGPAIARLHICEPAQPGLRVSAGPVERYVSLPAGAESGLRYTFHAPRGRYRWEQVAVTVSDAFGLFETRHELPAPAEVLVLPDAPLVKRLRLRPRHTLRTTGPHPSRRPGSGVEFYGVREYHPGDSLRWVHWRMSARYPGLFFSKDFEREEMADVGLIVDGSAATNLRRGDEDLFDYSLQAAAALAKNVLRMGNRLSVLVLGERVVRIFPGTGRRQYAHVLDQLAGCRPGENVSLSTLKYLPVQLFPSHSLIILISPLRASDFSTVTHLRASDFAMVMRLRARGYQVLLVSPDPVRFTSRGSRSPLAVRAARLERQALLWRMREAGVQVIDWPVDQPLRQVMDAFRWARR